MGFISINNVLLKYINMTILSEDQLAKLYDVVIDLISDLEIIPPTLTVGKPLTRYPSRKYGCDRISYRQIHGWALSALQRILEAVSPIHGGDHAWTDKIIFFECHSIYNLLKECDFPILDLYLIHLKYLRDLVNNYLHQLPMPN
jgi:hypothetical protein